MADGATYAHSRGPLKKAEVFKTTDGAELVGEFFLPVDAARGALVMNGATGVPQTFYRAFAEYAAQEHGFVVFTYDYRDMGRSGRGSVRRSTASMADWGLQDQQAARAYVRRNFPELAFWTIGHSLGAMTLPLQQDTDGIDRVICVASGNVSHSDHPWPYRAQALMFWFGLGPVVAGVFGYVPGKLLGIGADLPGPAYWQWRRWCTSKNTFGDEAGRSLPAIHWDQPETQVKFIAFDDDVMMPPHCVKRLARDYGKTDADVTVITPEAHGLKAVGHLSAFSRKNRAIWDQILA